MLSDTELGRPAIVITANRIHDSFHMQYHKMTMHYFKSIVIYHASDGINQYKFKFGECTASLIVSLDRTGDAQKYPKNRQREGLIIGGETYSEQSLNSITQRFKT